MRSRKLSLLRGTAFSIGLLCTLLIGCAAEVARQKAAFSPTESATASIEKKASQDTIVILDTGYRRVVRRGSRWHLTGRVSAGDVYASADSVFSVEGAQIHEAYLVVSRGNLVGFYLPVEKSYSPLSPRNVVKLWEE
jgi:hypothetical protein